MGRGGAKSAAFAAALSMAGCSTSHDIVVSGELERLVIAFLGPEGERIHLELCDVTVTEIGADGRQGRPAWEAADPEANFCLTVPKVIYGQAPETMIAEKAAAPLKPDTVYDISVAGSTVGWWSASSYGRGRFIFQRGAWRRVAD